MSRETCLSFSRWAGGSRSRHEWSAMTARRSWRRAARGAKLVFMGETIGGWGRGGKAGGVPREHGGVKWAGCGTQWA